MRTDVSQSLSNHSNEFITKFRANAYFTFLKICVLLVSELSRAEIVAENAQLQDKTRELRRKCAVIKDLIDGLRERYESSKRLGVFRRYLMLKTMIKTVIHDNLV